MEEYRKIFPNYKAYLEAKEEMKRLVFTLNSRALTDTEMQMYFTLESKIEAYEKFNI